MPYQVPFDALIEPDELALMLGDAATVVFDVRFSLAEPLAGKQLYNADHVSGAFYLDLDQDLSGEINSTTGRHPLPDADLLTEQLRRCGVSSDTQVVAYDDSSGGFAARLWWLLKWLGHDKVAVLNGGYAKWKHGGYPISAEVPRVPRGDFEPSLRTDLVVTTTELVELLKRDEFVLVDARTAERFRGEVEPIDKIAGHIPGAINLPFAGNVNAEGSFLSAVELKQRHTHRNSVHMCGSGVTGCHNVLASFVVFNELPRLYVGSWSEWITDDARPVAVGQ